MKQTLIEEISNIYNMVKGIETAHSKDNNHAFLISKNEVVYLCSIVKVKEEDASSYFSALRNASMKVYKDLENIRTTGKKMRHVLDEIKGFEVFSMNLVDCFKLVHNDVVYGLFLRELENGDLIENIKELFPNSENKELESLDKATLSETTIGDLVTHEGNGVKEVYKEEIIKSKYGFQVSRDVAKFLNEKDIKKEDIVSINFWFESSTDNTFASIIYQDSPE